MKKWMIGCLVSVLFCSCLSNDEDVSRSIEGKKYTSHEMKLSVEFPQSYALSLDEMVGKISIELVGRGNRVDGFTPNVVLMKSKTAGITDLNEILNILVQGELNAGMGVEILEQGLTFLSGISVAYFVAHVPLNGDIMMYKQYAFSRNGFDIQLQFSDLEKHFQTNLDFLEIEKKVVFWN